MRTAVAPLCPPDLGSTAAWTLIFGSLAGPNTGMKSGCPNEWTFPGLHSMWIRCDSFWPELLHLRVHNPDSTQSNSFFLTIWVFWPLMTFIFSFEGSKRLTSLHAWLQLDGFVSPMFTRPSQRRRRQKKTTLLFSSIYCKVVQIFNKKRCRKCSFLGYIIRVFRFRNPEEWVKILSFKGPCSHAKVRHNNRPTHFFF